MANLPANVLACVIAAARKLPPTTGVTDVFRARFAGAGHDAVILADVSQSMLTRDGGRRRRVDILEDALRINLIDRPNALVVAFNSFPVAVAPGGHLPEPEGGTALHLAIGAAAHYRPLLTLIITDGEPDDEGAALLAAQNCTGIINAIYCGPDDNIKAKNFLARLCAACGGRMEHVKVAGSPAILTKAISRLTLPDYSNV